MNIWSKLITAEAKLSRIEWNLAHKSYVTMTKKSCVAEDLQTYMNRKRRFRTTVCGLHKMLFHEGVEASKLSAVECNQYLNLFTVSGIKLHLRLYWYKNVKACFYKCMENERFCVGFKLNLYLKFIFPKCLILICNSVR